MIKVTDTYGCYAYSDGYKIIVTARKTGKIIICNRNPALTWDANIDAALAALIQLLVSSDIRYWDLTD